MIAGWIERRIARAERETGENADWLRDVARASRSAFLKFGAFMPLARINDAAPAEAVAVAKLAAVVTEDCGPCVQTVVNYSVAGGVDPAVLQAVLDEAPERLTEDLATVYRYAKAVAAAAPEANALVAEVRHRYGQEALVDLAMGIAATRVFPTAKRGLGYAVSCSKVAVETRDKRQERADA